MIESKLKANNCNRGSCFDLVGSRQHGVASYEIFSLSTDILACENSRPSSLPARVAFRVKDVCDLPPKIPY